MELNQDARAVLDAMREGINIIDAEGRIIFGNKAYLDFLSKETGIGIGSIEGQYLRDLRPGARLPEVLATGKPILHAPRMEKQDEIYFVNMYPIFQDGEMVGGLSVVTFLKDAYAFQTELEQYEKRNKQVLHRVNKANSARYTFDSIVAVGENVQAVKALAQKAAETDATVLLASESGTGKELYAQAIHNASARKNEVFVAINCANFNANTLESELFGYVEGAFTGAKKGGKIGLFEAANGGTLFLDEVSEMDYSLQAKLLRAIQEGRIRPVGGVQEIEVDVRLISASNADLNTYIQQGRFRRDLYYRLSTIEISVPPLRERASDIPRLVDHFVQREGLAVRFSPAAMDQLLAYRWPGNVRQLRNVVLRLGIGAAGQAVGAEQVYAALPQQPAPAPAAEPELEPLPAQRRENSGPTMEATEIRAIQEALAACGYNQSLAARCLGVGRTTLYRKMKKYGIPLRRGLDLPGRL